MEKLFFRDFGKMCEEVNKVVTIILYPLSSQSDQHWFSPNKSIYCQEKQLGEFLKRSPKGKVSQLTF